MATESNIAEGNTIVVSENVEYRQKLFTTPSYKYNAQFSNTFGQPINLGVSSTPVTINLPPDVFNLGGAYLDYTVTLPAPATPPGENRYIWIHSQFAREIGHLQYYGGNGQYIVDIDNLQNYLDITVKKETSLEDFLSLDPILNEVGQSNSPVNVVPALRNSTFQTTNTPNGPTHESSVNYLEPGYFYVGEINTEVKYKVQIPLRMIKNSFLSCNKNIYFGQNTYLKLYFGPLSKICYISSSNNNPSAGVKSDYASGVPGEYPRIENLQLMLPIEKNENIRSSLINKVATSGFSYLIPYIQSFKNPNQGSTQNISIQFNIDNGKYLQKVYHSIYNNQENLDTAYDHSNVSRMNGADYRQKVLEYWTTLNGSKQQDITLNCTYDGGFLDYLQHKRQMRGSVLSTLNVFQYNWYHCDDYTSFGAEYDQKNEGTLYGGIPMSIASLTWGFVGQKMRDTDNNAFQHYTWAVFLKTLTVKAGVVLVE
jgi:hypothetical protein